MAILVETVFLGHRLKSWGVPVHVKGKLVKCFWKNSGFFLRLLRALSVRLRAMNLLGGKEGLAYLNGNGSLFIVLKIMLGM